MKPHKCPVCNGSGKVFWPPSADSDPGSSGDLAGHWDCRACDGTGIVWEPAQSLEPKITVKFVPHTPANTDPLWANQTGDAGITFEPLDAFVGPFVIG